jgi:predicted O-methyltransferase YrrM
MGYSEDYIKQYGVLSRRFENIAHLRGDSLDFDFSGLNRTFDLIFIDGDHHYDMVRNDSHKVFTNLVHENTIVVWHDYANSPEQIRYEVMAGILDGTPKQYHDKLYFVSNTLCAIYTRRKLKSSAFVSPVRPEKVFEVNVKSKKLEE